MEEGTDGGGRGIDVTKIAVIGAGTMGLGIARVAARHGCCVYLHDACPETLRDGIKKITERLRGAVEKGKIQPAERDAILARILPIQKPAGLKPVELVIEAIDEDLDAKRRLFAALDAIVPASATLATNTSSLSITQIAEGVRDPARVIGMHFFNPATVMSLVEVVAGEFSAESSLDAGVAMAKRWSKTPVRVKDSPGFVVNRVARGFYLEALRLLDEGVAGVDEIDGVMRMLGGFPMGPFALMDLVGLDVSLATTTSVWERLNKPARLAPQQIQQELVDRGHLGCKTGRGFYLYDGELVVSAYPVKRGSFQLSPLLSDAMLNYTERGSITAASATEQLIFCRILSAVINEAGFVRSEGVAGAAEIDLAMVKGMNFRQGPLAWAGDIGPRTIRGVLKALNQTVTDHRFAPSPLFE